MRQNCAICNRSYDDADATTVCPHNPLHIGPNALYCRRCDEFDGKCGHRKLNEPVRHVLSSAKGQVIEILANGRCRVRWDNDDISVPTREWKTSEEHYVDLTLVE